MKTFTIVVAVFIIKVFVDVKASKQVPCESIADRGFHSFKAEKCCLMNEKTTIDTLKFTIESVKDETVKGLFLDSNKKIKFLPEKIHENFPNLTGLSAGGCSIESITADNFNGLTSLTHLYLHYNQIQRVSVEMFQELTLLAELALNENQIKFIGGIEDFRQFKHLGNVFLQGNNCIQQNFNAKNWVNMPLLKKRCGLCRNDDLISMTVCEASRELKEINKKNFEKLEQGQNLQNEKFQKFEVQVTSQTSNCEQLKIENARLEAKLNAATAAEHQTALTIELYEKLDGQRNKTFLAETEEMRNMITAIKRENKDLLDEIVEKTASINEKDQKIKYLESKLETIINNRNF